MSATTLSNRSLSLLLSLFNSPPPSPPPSPSLLIILIGPAVSCSTSIVLALPPFSISFSVSFSVFFSPSSFSLSVVAMNGRERVSELDSHQCVAQHKMTIYYIALHPEDCTTLCFEMLHTTSCCRTLQCGAEEHIASQGSSFIPGPRLIWTHPYARQLAIPYCKLQTVRSVICRV